MPITLPATGEQINTDEVAGINTEVVRVGYGALGVAPTATTSTTGAGLPVQVANAAAGAAAAAGVQSNPPLFIRKDVLTSPWLTGEADGDYAAGTLDENKAIWVSLATNLLASLGDSVQALPFPGIGQFVHKNKVYTTAQTGDAIWTPAAGKIFVVTHLRVSWSGATDGTIAVWASTTSTSDTAITNATDYVLFNFDAAPSTAGPGGFSSAMCFPGPLTLTANPLRVTTTAAINACKVQVDGYEVTPPA